MAYDDYALSEEDSLFNFTDRPNSVVDVAFFKSEKMRLFYIEGYRLAGDAAVDAFVSTNDWNQNDAMFMPVIYNYRHYLELLLKWYVEYGGVCGPAPKTHRLGQLWPSARKTIEAVWPDVDRVKLDLIEKIILEFHAIDPDGQHMRYEENNADEHTLKKCPDRVDLENIRDVMGKLSRFFKEYDFHWINNGPPNYDHAEFLRSLQPQA